MKDLPKLIASIVICEIVGIVSALFTISAIPTWYTKLVKPSFSPPNWLFGPVWTILYLMMGIAFYLIWIRGWKKKKIRTAGMFFLIQLAFNFLWSISFFGLRSPELGFINIVLLWLFIVVTMIRFYPLSKPSFYLLIPYLLWVSFAAVLNGAIVVLN